MNPDYSKLLNEIRNVISTAGDRDAKLLSVCKIIDTNLPFCDWTGFYIADDLKKNLLLGPYVGAATDHTKIAYGQGICGQAASREETFVVDDVTKEDNYLACSLTVKSEIVIPIMRNGEFLAELDIDSHQPAAFNANSKKFLETVANLMAKLF